MPCWAGHLHSYNHELWICVGKWVIIKWTMHYYRLVFITCSAWGSQGQSTWMTDNNNHNTLYALHHSRMAVWWTLILSPAHFWLPFLMGHKGGLASSVKNLGTPRCHVTITSDCVYTQTTTIAFYRSIFGLLLLNILHTCVLWGRRVHCALLSWTSIHKISILFGSIGLFCDTHLGQLVCSCFSISYTLNGCIRTCSVMACSIRMFGCANWHTIQWSPILVHS